MKRIDPLDTRKIAEVPFGFDNVDPASITQDDVNRLVVKIAMSLGIINARTFRAVADDPLITEEERATILSNMG